MNTRDKRIEIQKGDAMPDANQKASRWVALTERLPTEKSPLFLVTNNVNARNAYGHMSHVWLVSMVHKHLPGDKTIFNSDAYGKWGMYSAFLENDLRVCHLTHWLDLSEYLT